ncbi:jg12559 [Pararge aegeria aegeria]|uniref:Jg12559 protein n=1 Tax=Pararge aegeria aegeria TaxID=348720 RepID=A0A8S4SD09_9NEOP|nr:jg12559 [Pararge aegeria aegeria]
MHNQHLKQYTDHRISDMKLTSSASDQNVFFTYVCLVNEVKPSLSRNVDMNSPDRDLLRTSIHIMHQNADENIQEKSIQVERSKALHELVESPKHDHDDLVTTDHACIQALQQNDKPIDEDSKSDTEENNHYVNPKKLQLTKMKCSPYLTPDNSMSSINSGEFDDIVGTQQSYGEKCLSTILQLDREHNMFGLSNIAIVGKTKSKKTRKEDNGPVFPQTTIIQICCGRSCCKHKCGGCQGCCNDPCCTVSTGKCDDLPPSGPSLCSQCPRGKPTCKTPCAPSKCSIDCNTCYGLKPMAARSCHHLPQCIPPTSCFPYLMPCYWPARAGAPCNNPSQCFHNPPCRPPRKRKLYIPPEEVCPKLGKCETKDTKCSNQACPGSRIKSLLQLLTATSKVDFLRLSFYRKEKEGEKEENYPLRMRFT